MSILIIAEAGVNHNGNLDLARELISVASASGADFVKFQTFSADKLVTRYAQKAKYQRTESSDIESQYEMLKKLELSSSQLIELMQYADSVGIKLISTAFDSESADTLLELGQTIFKIPSGEITNLPYLRHVGSFRKSILLSTGMSDMQEISNAVDVLVESGTSKSDITVLHCTSAYPAPYSDVNLLAINTIRNTLEIAVGYSDHSLGIEVAISAAALGAAVIEKHFTVDKSLPGPDHKASLDPKELTQMVLSIRNIELALGNETKSISQSEVANRDVIRKSIVAKAPILKGEMFTINNLTTKRPGNGISPFMWDSIVGKFASRDYLIDEQIEE